MLPTINPFKSNFLRFYKVFSKKRNGFKRQLSFFMKYLTETLQIIKKPPANKVSLSHKMSNGVLKLLNLPPLGFIHRLGYPPPPAVTQSTSPPGVTGP